MSADRGPGVREALFQSRIAITGGTGFLGRALSRFLGERGYRNIVPLGRADFDLLSPNDVSRLFQEIRPEILIHLAAVVGGIGANRKRPGTFFFENAMMGLQVMEQARRAGVRKFVTIGTVCSYPAETRAPFSEQDLWNGYPEETNAPYGLAKKMLLVQGVAYKAEFGFPVIHLLPANLYGPGDNTDPASSHVIPALIRKCLDARRKKAPQVVAWGDGSATREFLYVDDAAEGITLAIESYEKPEPVNIGSGTEISIRELAIQIARLTGFEGRITWDQSMPNGQRRRLLDCRRAEGEFGFRARTPLEEGLRRTIEAMS